MRAIVVLLAFTAVGCRSYIEIYDAAAERGEGEEVVVRFKANRDVTRSAQFYGAGLAVLSQIDAEREGADRALEHGHGWAGADKLIRVSETDSPSGKVYQFHARFPLRGQYVHEKSGFFTRTTVPHPYDLTSSGSHPLEFWAGGGNCGGPGGFYTNRLRLTYHAP